MYSFYPRCFFILAKRSYFVGPFWKGKKTVDPAVGDFARVKRPASLFSYPCYKDKNVNSS